MSGLDEKLGLRTTRSAPPSAAQSTGLFLRFLEMLLSERFYEMTAAKTILHQSVKTEQAERSLLLPEYIHPLWFVP
jgi:hypothetical protein